MPESKLILGTATFGQPYSIKGDPVPDEKELEKIARVAWDGGIRVIHTSWQYNLPKICEAIFSEFERMEKEEDNPHYFNWNGRRGYSIYETKEEEIFSGDVEMLMVPANILDRRFIPHERDKEFGWSFIVRSVFLQGLLLMEELPDWLPAIPKVMIRVFQKASRAEGYEPYEAALGYVLGLDEIDRVIVGVNSAKQLEQLVKVKPLKWDYDFSITDENVLDPRRWPKCA